MVDRSPLPARYRAALPATVDGMRAWAQGDPTLPPVGHVVDLLLAGDAAMLAAVERSAARVPSSQVAGWVSAWRASTRFKSGTERYCSRVRSIMDGAATPLRDALSGAYAASCRKPQELASLLRPDTAYWAVIEAYEDTADEAAPPPDHDPLARAALQAIDAGDDDAVRDAAWALAYRAEPAAWASLRALHARISDRKEADQLAMAFFRTRDPQLHALAWSACARMPRQHPMCESGPAPHDTDEHAATPPAVSAADLAAMRQTLAGLGFHRVAGLADARFEAADATSVLAASGYIHGFDAETGQFPNAHDSLLRTLAPLVQPALDGAVFEEQAPDQESGPYRLVAYLDGKRYHMLARNLDDWYDIDAVLRLLNAMLADRARAERFASLHTNDQIAWVVGAPQSALQAAFKAGVLQPGDAGGAEQQGKAFEHAVMQELKQ
ncbi:hypothetical protein [Xanthomonas floridensis]|uniref:Uncharacterized protein n=1 Tax=Xanthomonas floridensis TaxID=1843580 RepID=A0A1A9MGL5_9XANT|nr:hypothetical protein [Xanthomonas floridensis]MEA5123617.1 hypothetical protein [Xanthomonas floridensis]MEA5130483.1 hypothetical protein [Xanthomonas floridensis]OAG69282.1 hypothetical protein A7D17_00205 [Xanthomonas floridensis]